MSIILTSRYDCYENIIGLSRTPVDCYDPKTGYELDYNTSYSGLYLDELQPLNRVKDLEKTLTTVWDILDNGRDNGIKQFVRDGQQELMKEYRLRHNPYKGIIGRIKAKLDRSITKTYAGVQFFCKDNVGTILKINSIGTIMNFTGTIDVTCYDNIGQSHGTVTLNTTADTLNLNSLITPFELPLHSDYCDNLRYYFVYELTGAQQPRNNDLCCNCGGFRPVFNPNIPYFNKSYGGRYGWANYVMVGGSEMNELDFDETDYGASQNMNGLIFDVDIKCHIAGILCRDELDFDADPVAISIAYAVLYASGIYLIEKFFSDPRLNLGKIIDREYLAVRQKEMDEKYKEHLIYIGKTIDVTKTDCIVCRDHQRITRKPMLV